MLIGRTLLLLLLLISTPVQSQDEFKYSKTKSIEGNFIPILGFNHLSAGYSVLKPHGVETSVVLACNVHFLSGGAINLNVTFNRNYFLKGKGAYVPIWCRISNTRRNGDYEEGYWPHTLRFSIGSGIGDIVKFSERFFMRTEIGLGISLNLTNPQGSAWPFKFDYASYSTDSRYPRQQPPILPALRFRVSFMKPLRQKSSA